MPVFSRMEQTELYATAPPAEYPPSSITPAMSAIGVPGGAADRAYWNGFYKRLTEIMWRTQELAEDNSFTALTTVCGDDTNLEYRDHFIGNIGDDATQRTPIEGNELTNDSGAAVGEYLIGGNSALFRTAAVLYPLYTDIGENHTNRQSALTFFSDDNVFSATGDRVAVCINCIGAYQRTDVALVYTGGSTPTLTPTITEYDTSGVIVGTAETGPPIDFSLFKNRSITMNVTDLTAGNVLSVDIPELDYVFTSTVSNDPGTSSNKHGFLCTPHTFSITTHTITNNDIYVVIP